MQRAVMQEAERHGELVADLGSHRSRLGKAGMRGCSATEDTGLGGNELQMLGVPKPLRRGQRQFQRARIAWVWFGERLARSVEPLGSLLIDPLEQLGIMGPVCGLEIGPGGPEVSDRRCIAG